VSLRASITRPRSRDPGLRSPHEFSLRLWSSCSHKLQRDSCDKYYRFLSVLDAYKIPLINLVDTPPVVPGEDEEKLGLLRHGGKIIDLYATTSIPKISIVLRQAYGDAGAFIMGVSKSMGADICYAWPNAIMAVEISEMNIHKAYKGGGIEEDAYRNHRHRSGYRRCSPP
jgi:propionyl-CoA carboxylase beta chain